MSDTEIQYIGEWSSSQSAIPSATAFVSALILTTTEDSIRSSSTFSRNQSPVVFIGRAAYNDLPEHEGRATYANPVMSRRHAKIIFSETGSVSLVDTNSHHGTWVNRKTEEFKLSPNSPLRLEDGDRITFGKEVVKEGNVHKPLVITIKLLCNATTPSPRSKSSSLSPESTTRSPRSTRNRFGLSSSSESGSSSDSDEEHLDDIKGFKSIESISPLFGIASPQSNSNVISRSPPAICESLPPIDPGVEEDIPQVEVGNVEDTSNSQSSSVPPWRRFPHPPWFDMTTNFFRHVPDILPRPSPRPGQPLGSHSYRFDTTTHQAPHQHHHQHHQHGQHHHQHHHGHGQHHHHNHNPHDVPTPSTPNNDVKDLKEDIRTLKDELQSLKTSVTKLDESRVTIGQIQNLLGSLENRIPDLSLKSTEEYLSSPRSPLKSIEETITEIKGTLSTLQSRLSFSDKSFSDTLKQNASSMRDLDTKINIMDGYYEDLRSKWDSDRQAIKVHTSEADLMKTDLATLRKDLKSLESKFLENGQERMDVCEEARLESRIRDCVKTELERLRESAESNPVLGKRKRSTDEDYVDATVQTVEGTSLITPPPSKKVRVLNQCLVAGTIGALGAWLGLAYL